MKGKEKWKIELFCYLTLKKGEGGKVYNNVITLCNVNSLPQYVPHIL